MSKRLKMSESTLNKCVISFVFCRLLPDYYHRNRRENAESESSKLDTRQQKKKLRLYSINFTFCIFFSQNYITKGGFVLYCILIFFSSCDSGYRGRSTVYIVCNHVVWFHLHSYILLWLNAPFLKLINSRLFK